MGKLRQEILDCIDDEDIKNEVSIKIDEVESIADDLVDLLNITLKSGIDDDLAEVINEALSTAEKLLEGLY